MSVKGSIQRRQKSGKGEWGWQGTANTTMIAWEATQATQVRQGAVGPADGLALLIQGPIQDGDPGMHAHLGNRLRGR